MHRPANGMYGTHLSIALFSSTRVLPQLLLRLRSQPEGRASEVPGSNHPRESVLEALQPEGARRLGCEVYKGVIAWNHIQNKSLFIFFAPEIVISVIEHESALALKLLSVLRDTTAEKEAIFESK